MTYRDRLLGPRNGARRRTLGRALLIFVIALLLYTAIGFLLVPWIARGQVEKVLAEQLDRPVQIESIRFNPFKLFLKVRHLRVGAKQDDGNHDRPLFKLGALDVDAAWRSLFQLAPVISSVHIDAPQLSVARRPDGRYSIQDLLDKWGQPSPTPSTSPVPGFSVSNIVLSNGRVEFDDQQKTITHDFADLALRVPFLSSLEVYEDVKVEPLLAATHNGSHFSASGTTEPFSENRRSSIDIEFNGIELDELAAYSPMPPPLKVAAGRLNVKVSVLFEQPPKAKPTIHVSGQAALNDIDLRELDDSPLLKLGALTAAGLNLQVQDNDFRVASVTIDGLDAVVHRRSGQQQFFQSVLDALAKNEQDGAKQDGAKQDDVRQGNAQSAKASMPDRADAAATPGSASGAESAKPLRWQVDSIDLNGAKLDFADQQFSPQPLAVKFDPINVKVTDLSSEAGRPLAYKLDIKTAQNESLSAEGKAVITPLSVDGRFDVDQIALKNWWWLTDSKIAADLTDGQIGLGGRYQVAMPDAGLQLKLDDLGVKLTGLTLISLREGEPAKASNKARSADSSALKATELLSIPELTISGSRVDLNAQRIVLGAIKSTGGRIGLRRDADGRFNVQKLLVSAPTSNPAAVPPTSQDATVGKEEGTAKEQYASASPPASAWTATLERLQFDQYAIDVSDTKAGKVGDIRVDQLAIGLQNLTVLGPQPKGDGGKLDLKARINQRGALTLTGPLSLSPVSTRLAVDARDLSLLPAQPYVSEYLNAVLTGGRFTAKGDLALDFPDTSPAKIQWKGNASIDEFATASHQSHRNLLRWKSLAVKGIDMEVEPLRVHVADITLASLYARVILSAQGRLNLQDLAVDKNTSAPSQSATTDAKSNSARTEPPPDIQIGKITLVNANVDFSDFFVRPNYSVNLTGLNGGISKLSPDQPGDVLLKGRVDNTGIVDVSGRLNPFSSALTMDIVADARDIDLPRLSPYSAKYIGHGIERGKLSAKLNYKLIDRQLTADNKVVLDQLTLGDRIADSKAPNLPVQFALSLLKDREGVIDVELPISGSIDDPQFSIGGIVLRLIGNLVVKAVTSPFALIGGLVGGDGVQGAELSKMPFAPGSTQLAPVAIERLQKLAKVLRDRPTIKVDIGGRANAERDSDALHRLRLQRRVKALKVKENFVDEGTEFEHHLDSVALPPAEYERYLKQLYRDAPFDKPRNFLGFIKDVPVAEMESRLLEGSQLSERQFQVLADRRAQAVKDWLAQTGQIGTDRLYIVSSKVDSATAATAERLAKEAVPSDPKGDETKPAQADAPRSTDPADIGVELGLRG